MSLMPPIATGWWRGHSLRTALGSGWRSLTRAMANMMPKGLYTRSLLIVIIPIVLLQTVVAYVFMERHWELVTRRLSSAVARDISALVDISRAFPGEVDQATLRRIARDDLLLSVDMLPDENLPPPGPKPFFSILDQALSTEIANVLDEPFWIDTVGQGNLIEIRVKLDNGVMRIVARRNQAYASNSHIFLVWMVGASLILITVAILFLRNQIRPILQLANAAESLGKGRDVADFRPRGASEVRRASIAFHAMKARIERQIEQRTTMLAGVSHDLRTVLTRFRLELAMFGDCPELEEMKRDVDEMERMLHGYLAFARGDSGEVARPTDVAALIREVAADAGRAGSPVELSVGETHVVEVRPDAMKRCLGNLIANASRYGQRVRVEGQPVGRDFVVTVDDDGPGIPEHLREEVFRPFLRLDEARNQDHPGSGLGLSIARDVARGHGGDLSLEDSPFGGLRAVVRIPV